MQTRARNRNFLIFLFISTFAVHQLHARIPLGQLRGTYYIVRKGYERISPINGPILWYSGNVKNIHRLGKNHHLYPLVASLFNYVPGQFTITQNRKYPAYYLDAQSVARIILKIEKFIKDDIETLTQNQINELRTLIVNEIQSKNIGTPQPKNIDALVTGMEKAFNKSGYFDNNPNLFKYGLHTILLAFLYEKGESVNDFRKYFDEFDLTYLKKKFTITAPYTIDMIPKIEERFLRTLKIGITPTELHGEISFEEYVYAFIMKAHFLSPFVEATGYKNANYKVGNFTWSSPDCMETLIRDLCNNIVRYLTLFMFDPRKQMVALNLKWIIDKALENFYTKYPDQGETGLPTAHDYWTNVVSNREFITYKRINDLNNSTEKGIEAPNKVDGFVIVKNLKTQIDSLDRAKKRMFKLKKYRGYDLIELTVGKRRYYLFDPKEKPNLRAYEIKPSVRNLITILNHLFGLNIFTKTNPQETQLEKTLLKTDFNSTYIKTAFEKIGLPKIKATGGDIDADDLTKKNIALIINKKKSQLKLTLYDEHGYAAVTMEPLENKLALINKLLPIFANKDLPISFKNSLLFSLNKPGYEQVMNLALYKIINLQDLLLNLDLSSESEKIEALIQIINEKIIDKLIATKDESTKKLIPIIKQFWINLIKSIPLVGGENQRYMSRKLTPYKYVIDTLLSSNEEDFKNESFLVFFFKHLYPFEKVVWSNNIKEAIKVGAKKTHAISYVWVVSLLTRFLEKQNPEAIEVAKRIVETKIRKKVPIESLSLAISIYSILIRFVYSKIPPEQIKEKELLIKKFEDKIKYLIKRKDIYDKISENLLKLLKIAIQNNFIKDGKIKAEALQLIKTSAHSPRELPSLITRLFQSKEINEDDYFLMINKTAGITKDDNFTILKSFKILLEKNIISKPNKILDITKKIIRSRYWDAESLKELASLLIIFKNKKLINLDNIIQVYKIYKILLLLPPLDEIKASIEELKKEKILKKAISALELVHNLKEIFQKVEYSLRAAEASPVDRKKRFDQLSEERVKELQKLIDKKYFPKETRKATEQSFEHLKKEQWLFEETRELIEKLAQILADSFK